MKIDAALIQKLLQLDEKGQLGAESYEDLDWFIKNQALLKDLRTGQLQTVARRVLPDTPWNRLFGGRFDIIDPNFNESVFPLESDAEMRPVERVYEFKDVMSGFAALRTLDKEGWEMARPRAVGLFLADQPLKEKRPLVGGGRCKRSAYLPPEALVFARVDGRSSATLNNLRNRFQRSCGWLVVRKPP